MRKETKLKVCKTTARLIITYALEIRVQKKRHILEANEMKVLRKIVGKTEIDKIRSLELRES